jgi:hypothetical protein
MSIVAFLLVMTPALVFSFMVMVPNIMLVCTSVALIAALLFSYVTYSTIENASRESALRTAHTYFVILSFFERLIRKILGK